MTQFKKGDKLILRKGNTVIHGTATYDSADGAPLYLAIEGLPFNVNNGFRQSDFEIEVVKPPLTFVKGMVAKINNDYYLRLEQGKWFSTFTRSVNPFLSDGGFVKEDIVYDPRDVK